MAGFFERRRKRAAWLVAGAVVSLTGGACAGAATSPATEPQRLIVEVRRILAHDTDSFTQGLVIAGGELYESRGHYGESSVRRLDRLTGRVLAERPLAPELFAEGLAAVGESLVQLTWKEGVAIVWDRATLTETGRYGYTGLGWGLCSDGRRLYQSDGSEVLVVRHPRSFAARGRLSVTLEGQPVRQLNELECAEGWIYANLLGSDTIARIDPHSGRVTALIDASGLLTPSERQQADVLNGIAYDDEAGVFLLTGKYWPKMFEVVFRAP
ncbi:MAG: glutaminyl-peptide cyclotransferase [Thermoanaerobaculia bacterium]